MSEGRKVAVDGILVYKGHIVFVKRKYDPFKGLLALPGGMVEEDETVEQAVLREVKEETGISAKIIKVVGVYSKPKRDPRGNISVAFILGTLNGEPKAGDDAAEVVPLTFADLAKQPRLAFDHGAMIRNAYGYLRTSGLMEQDLDLEHL